MHYNDLVSLNPNIPPCSKDTCPDYRYTVMIPEATPQMIPASAAVSSVRTSDARRMIRGTIGDF